MEVVCGTKVLRRSDYVRFKMGRSYFGNFDPFGDFDLNSAHRSCALKLLRFRSATLTAPMERAKYLSFVTA